MLRTATAWAASCNFVVEGEGVGNCPLLPPPCLFHAIPDPGPLSPPFEGARLLFRAVALSSQSHDTRHPAQSLIARIR